MCFLNFTLFVFWVALIKGNWEDGVYSFPKTIIVNSKKFLLMFMNALQLMNGTDFLVIPFPKLSIILFVLFLYLQTKMTIRHFVLIVLKIKLIVNLLALTISLALLK